jgi:hypothetical protein
MGVINIILGLKDLRQCGQKIVRNLFILQKKTYTNYDIYVYNTNGTNELRITDTTKDELYPEYSLYGTG